MQSKYMAMAFGAKGGKRDTNSRQALEFAVKKGFARVSTDISITTDGELVCSKGWTKDKCKKYKWTYKPEFDQMTAKMFKEDFSLANGFDTLTVGELLDYMEANEDLVVVAQLFSVTAGMHKVVAKKLQDLTGDRTALLERLVIQVTSPEVYEEFESVCHFPKYEYRVMNEAKDGIDVDGLLSFADKENIVSLGMRPWVVRSEMFSKIKESGKHITVYYYDNKYKADEMLSLGADTVATAYIGLYFHQQHSPVEELEMRYDDAHKKPVQMNKVVFVNFHGKGFGCNPKYIALKLLEKKKDLDLVWLSTGKNEMPEGIRTVKFHSAKAIKELATARVIVENQMVFPGFKKRADQFFIETWHGAIPLKKLGMDNIKNIYSKKYIHRMRLNFNNIDLLLSNSDFCTNMFRRGYEYEGWVLQHGAPRNDLFFEDYTKYKEQVCKVLNIPVDKKLIVYAPTFRGDKNLDCYDLDYQKVLDALGEEYVMLIRLHPHLQSKAKTLLQYTDRIVNASDIPDMQVLMAASDILISDYSNVMFEFMLSGRPCYLYASDIEAYKEERDYYFDLEKLPFPISETTDQLIEVMKHYDMEKYHSETKKFFDRLGLNETGHAAEDVADIILKMVSDEKYQLSKVDGVTHKGVAMARRYKLKYKLMRKKNSIIKKD